MASSYVALLRGINVSGKNKLPMDALKALFEEETGCAKVRSYIQSGNIVFDCSDSKVADRLSENISGRIHDQFGFVVPVVVRSARELGAVIKINPFLCSVEDVKQLHVAFLSREPNKAAVDSLDTERSPGDEFVVIGSEVFLWLPHGVARTKLANAYFDRELGCVCTMRNWKTVCRLWEMVGG